MASGQTAYPNFNSLELVQVGVTQVSATTSPTNWTSVNHNLGYAPVPFAFLNGVSLSGISSSGNLPLPTLISGTIDTTNHVVQFSSWLFCMADAQKVYFVLYNSTGAVINPYYVKYFLLRERAD